MYNKKILFFLFSLFFLLPFTTNALSYTVNEKEYQVTDDESLRDYCYFTYFKKGLSDFNISFDSFFVFKYNDLYPKCVMFDSQSGSKHVSIGWNSVYYDSGTNPYVFHISDDYSEVSVESSSSNNFGGGVNSILYSNFNIGSLDSDTLPFNSNFNVEDIENKYIQSTKPIEVEKNDYVISKEEYYLLLMLLSLLIWLLYFKWCFPMKGGKKI